MIVDGIKSLKKRPGQRESSRLLVINICSVRMCVRVWGTSRWPNESSTLEAKLRLSGSCAAVRAGTKTIPDLLVFSFLLSEIKEGDDPLMLLFLMQLTTWLVLTGTVWFVCCLLWTASQSFNKPKQRRPSSVFFLYFPPSAGRLPDFTRLTAAMGCQQHFDWRKGVQLHLQDSGDNNGMCR